MIVVVCENENETSFYFIPDATEDELQLAETIADYCSSINIINLPNIMYITDYLYNINSYDKRIKPGIRQFLTPRFKRNDISFENIDRVVNVIYS